MKIALSYAMPKEIDSLLSAGAAQALPAIAGVSFYQLRDHLIAFAGGVGKVNAAMAAQLCIDHFHPDLIVNVGVAGCFENVEIGTLILPTGFIQHDVDTSGCGDPVGLVSTVNMIQFPTSDFDTAQRALKQTGFPFLTGLGATGDWFAQRGARATHLSDTFHPLFIEMEGCAIAQVCHRNHIKFMALKSVSDCLFGNDQYDFNFLTAMKDLNTAVRKFIDQLESQL